MEQKNYHSGITAKISPKEAFDAIARVDAWWAKSFEGKASKTGDRFTVRFGTTKVDFEIAEVIPEKKVVWKVTDCYLPFLNDKTEWNGTTVDWEVSSESDKTVIHMTHIGLMQGIECYEACTAGWNDHILGSLNNLINNGEGQPK